MFTPTKAACHHTKVANAVSAVQTADVLSISGLNGKQSDSTHLLHAAGGLQLRPPEDQVSCSYGPLKASRLDGSRAEFVFFPANGRAGLRFQRPDSSRLIEVNVNR